MPPFFILLSRIYVMYSMRSFLSIIFLLAFHCAMGQLQFYADTLTYFDRIGGRLDSVDIANALTPTSFNGGRAIWGPSGATTENLLHDRTRRVFDRKTEMKQMRFSALPHIGFAYSFGGQSSQFLRAEYQQAFTQSTLLNIDIVKNREEGYLRNGSYDNSQLNIAFQHSGNIYSTKLSAFYYTTDVTHNGGVTTDSLIEDFGLIFTPVNKASSNSLYKTALVNVNNYLDVIRDSTRQLGLITKHRYDISNREFTESDTLYGLYSEVNIDSLSTRDQYNIPAIRNGIGLFGSLGNHFYADVSFDHRYWRYQNLGVNSDTNETYASGNATFALNDLRLSADFDINLTGAYQGVQSGIAFDFNRKAFKVSGRLSYDAAAPDVMNRYHFANNYAYDLKNIQQNQILSASASGKLNLVDSILFVGADFNMHQLDKYYLFDGSSWRNDTLQGYSFYSASINLGLSIKALNIRTRLVFARDPGGYLPKMQSYSRIYLKRKVFKAQKLELLVGAEPQWSASYRQRVYLPYADMMYWFDESSETGSLFNLHAFLGFKLDEFRFYVRYENIGYFWNDQTTYVMDNYPLAGQRLRVGITWDFYN